MFVACLAILKDNRVVHLAKTDVNFGRNDPTASDMM